MENETDAEQGRQKQVERELLAIVLAEHPARLTLPALQARLGRSAQVERAVEALVGHELLSREREEVAPTPAAIRFNELEPIER